MEKRYNKNRLIKIGLIILGILTLRFLIGIFFIAFGFYLGRKNNKHKQLEFLFQIAREHYDETLTEYTGIFIQPLANKIMPNEDYRSFRTEKTGIIYSNTKFIYFNSHTGLLVAYNNFNIKEVSRERLHVGADTQGSADTTGVAYTNMDTGVTVGNATTNSQASTLNVYEWHFDILTDFISYPKVSLVLNDTLQVENFIGQAYAILKP